MGHIEATAIEQDRHSEVLPVSVSMSRVSNLLDLGIEVFSRRICAIIAQVTEDPIKVSFHHPGDLDNWLQVGVSGREVAALELLLGLGNRPVLP